MKVSIEAPRQKKVCTLPIAIITVDAPIAKNGYPRMMRQQQMDDLSRMTVWKLGERRDMRRGWWKKAYFAEPCPLRLVKYVRDCGAYDDASKGQSEGEEQQYVCGAQVVVEDMIKRRRRCREGGRGAQNQASLIETQ